MVQLFEPEGQNATDSNITAGSDSNEEAPASRTDTTDIAWTVQANVTDRNDVTWATPQLSDADWATGTYRGGVECSVLGANSTFKIQLSRYLSTDSRAEILATSTSQSSTGPFVYAPTSINPAAGATGDRLVMEILTTRPANHGNEGITMVVNDVDSLLEVPFDASGTAFEVTASQTLTHSSVNPVIKGANRAPAQTLTHIDSAVSGFGKSVTASQTLTHSESVVILREYSRIVAQNLLHSESIAKLTERFVTAAQTLVHSEVVAIITGVARTASQIITHSESIAKITEAMRTATQTLTHIDAVSRAGSTFNRIASQILTHSEAIAQLSTFARAIAQSLTHSDSVVIETTAAPPSAVQPRNEPSAIKPLRPIHEPPTTERLTVFLQVTLFKKELTSATISSTIGLRLYQRESLTTLIKQPEKWLTKDHTKFKLNLVLKQKERLISTLRLKLTEYKVSDHLRALTQIQQEQHQSLIKSLKLKDKELTALLKHIKQLKREGDAQKEFIESLKTALDEYKKKTMTADDILALFAASD